MRTRGKRRWLFGAGALSLLATLAPRGSAETEVEAAATAGQSTGGWTCGPRGQARYGGVAGQVFTVFIIVLAASEAAIALAIVLQVYRNYRSIMADRLTALKN